MSKDALKPAAVVAGLTLLLAGYVAGVVYEIITKRLAICLSPFAFLAAIVVLATIGAYVVLVVTSLSDLMSRMKVSFLRKHGIETQAVIIQSELHYGPGLHDGDPCFKGQYHFMDQRGRKHAFKFRRGICLVF